jgi:hypothetical protein
MRIEQDIAYRTTDAPGVSASLIGDWAARVMDLWVESREPARDATEASEELGDACRVRDELNNRLERAYEDSAPCAERALQTLRNADALFMQFTVESTTAQSLSSHNHYAHRGEWWWRRLPRQRSSVVAA